MKASTKDRTAGKTHEVKGAIKEKTGSLTNNPNLIAKGRDEKAAGRIQNKVGQVERVFEK